MEPITIMSIVASYLQSNIPTIKELVDNNKDVKMRVEECYQKALKKWCKNDDIRTKYSNRSFAYVKDLKEYITNSKGVIPSDLIQLWVDEIRNDSICYKWIIELKIDKLLKSTEDQITLSQMINSTVKNNGLLLNKLNIKTDLILSGVTETNFKMSRGRMEHTEVPNYIRRYCTSEKDLNDYYYLLGESQHNTLADYVTGIVGSNNKFILYSDAQTGKTTELRNLCWELQQSELYQPISFEVKTSCDVRLEQLPQKQFIANKEVVVIIDALDEINGEQKKTFLRTIKAYAYENPTIKIVLSCRSNYRKEERIQDFQELYLSELTWEDACSHIQHMLSDGRKLISLIEDLKLRGFAYQPFFLNVLINAYREKKALPKNRIEIYELFAQSSYRLEKREKTTLDSYHPSFKEIKILFEKIALVMSLLNRQSLSEEEFETCLNYDKSVIEECKRYEILVLEEERYSFKHNAFREWLVASYLFQEGLEKAKKLVSYPNGKIKPEWYNIIILWLSFYSTEHKEQTIQIIEWLSSICKDLVIYTDRNILNESMREEIFKKIVLEYKTLGIRISATFSHEYRDLIEFCQTENTINFVAKELREAPIGSTYYADLLSLAYYIKWKLLKIQSSDTFNMLLEILERKMDEELQLHPSGSLIYLVFENSFFYKAEYLDRFYNLVRYSSNYDAIKMMLHLIISTNAGDKYVDFILEKEKYVHDYYDGYASRAVSRDGVYDSLSTVTTPEGIKKIICHNFKMLHHQRNSEWEKYCSLLTYCLDKTSEFIQDGQSEFIPLIEKCFITHFGDEYSSYSNDISHDELLKTFRKVYHNTGLDIREKEQFDNHIRELFSDSANRRTIFLFFRKTGLWLTAELLDQYYEHLSPTNSFDNTFASWFSICPNSLLKEKASQKHKDFFPKSKSLQTMATRRQKAVDLFANYNLFKQTVLETVGRNYSSNYKELEKLADKAINERLGRYIYDYILQFKYTDDQIRIHDVIQSIKKKQEYDLFFMLQISNQILNGSNKEDLNERYKTRCLETCKEFLESVNSPNCRYSERMINNAIQLLLLGYISIRQEALLTLLPFSNVSVTRYDEHDFPKSYNLFDYVKENISPENLAGPCILLLKNKSIENEYQIASFLIENRIEESYDILLDQVLDKSDPQIYLAEMMLKEGIMIDELKAASELMDINDKLQIYSFLKHYQNEREWVKLKLEPIFRQLDDKYALYKSLSLLTDLGSIEALAFITDDLSILINGQNHCFNYNYDSTEAIPLLMKTFVYVRENRICYPSGESSLISSLQNIAIQSYESFHLVESAMKEQINRKGDFKYLNRYIVQFENKLYELRTQFVDVEDVLKFLKTEI